MSMGKINSNNPLNDDGLCFRLMLKHKIRLSGNDKGDFVAMYAHSKGIEHPHANTAICLAILEKTGVTL